MHALSCHGVESSNFNSVILLAEIVETWEQVERKRPLANSSSAARPRSRQEVQGVCED